MPSRAGSRPQDRDVQHRSCRGRLNHIQPYGHPAGVNEQQLNRGDSWQDVLRRPEPLGGRYGCGGGGGGGGLEELHAGELTSKVPAALKRPHFDHSERVDQRGFLLEPGCAGRADSQRLFTRQTAVSERKSGDTKGRHERHDRRCGDRVSLAAVSVLALGFAGSSARASAWSRPVVLQPNVDMAAAAVDVAAGRTIAAWEGSTGVWAAIWGRRWAVRPAAAQPGEDCERGDPPAGGQCSWGCGAGVGDACAFQARRRRGCRRASCSVAYRRADGRFGRTHRVASATDGADIAIDRRGEVTIVWEGLSAAHRPAGLYVTHREHDGRYGRTRRLIDHRTGDFALEVDPRGDMALVWTEGGLASPALRFIFF